MRVTPGNWSRSTIAYTAFRLVRSRSATSVAVSNIGNRSVEVSASSCLFSRIRQRSLQKPFRRRPVIRAPHSRQDRAPEADVRVVRRERSPGGTSRSELTFLAA